jgi:hypothetical protein
MVKVGGEGSPAKVDWILDSSAVVLLAVLVAGWVLEEARVSSSKISWRRQRRPSAHAPRFFGPAGLRMTTEARRSSRGALPQAGRRGDLRAYRQSRVSGASRLLRLAFGEPKQ